MGTLRRAIRAVVLTVRFLLELSLVGALAAGGWELGGGGVVGALLGAAAALAVAVVWGTWIGPRSSRRLPDPARLALELTLFALGGVALWAAWTPFAGIVLAGASALAAALTRAVGEPTPSHRK